MSDEVKVALAGGKKASINPVEASVKFGSSLSIADALAARAASGRLSVQNSAEEPVAYEIGDGEAHSASKES